jgi:hypothetical protein
VDSAQAGPSRIQPASIPEEASVSEPSIPSTSISTTLSSASLPPPSPVPNPKSKPKAKPTPKARTKQKPSQDDSNSEPETTVASLFKQRRAKIAEEEAQKASLAAAGYEDEPMQEDHPMEVAEPSTSTKEPAASKASGAREKTPAEVDESVVILAEEEDEEEEEEPNLPKGKAKNRIQTIVPEPVQPSKSKASKPKKRIEDLKRATKSKTKVARGKRKQDSKDDESDNEVVSRKASGEKRAEQSDDEDDDRDDSGRDIGPSGTHPFSVCTVPSTNSGRSSAAKRTKTKSNPPKKPKTKPKPKPKSKTKPQKPAKSSSTSASSNYHSAPESPELAEPQDIMVPIQDSPPSRPKSKSNRRRYTLMPVRTEAQMADPDFDPMDCIGWQ